jgi:hypothetical protein
MQGKGTENIHIWMWQFDNNRRIGGMKYWVVGFVVCTLQRATERRNVPPEGQRRKFAVSAFSTGIRGAKLIKETKKHSEMWRREIDHRRWRTFATNGNFLPTFRENLSVPSSGFKNPNKSPKQESKILLDSWTLKMGPIVESPKSRLLLLLGPVMTADLIYLCWVCAVWRDCSVTRQGAPVPDPLILEGSSWIMYGFPVAPYRLTWEFTYEVRGRRAPKHGTATSVNHAVGLLVDGSPWHSLLLRLTPS